MCVCLFIASHFVFYHQIAASLNTDITKTIAFEGLGVENPAYRRRPGGDAAAHQSMKTSLSLEGVPQARAKHK